MHTINPGTNYSGHSWGTVDILLKYSEHCTKSARQWELLQDWSSLTMVARPTAFDKMGDEISLNENVKKSDREIQTYLLETKYIAS